MMRDPLSSYAIYIYSFGFLMQLFLFNSFVRFCVSLHNLINFSRDLYQLQLHTKLKATTPKGKVALEISNFLIRKQMQTHHRQNRTMVAKMNHISFAAFLYIRKS